MKNSKKFKRNKKRKKLLTMQLAKFKILFLLAYIFQLTNDKEQRHKLIEQQKLSVYNYNNTQYFQHIDEQTLKYS